MVSTTIGLPVYNGAAYLDAALASLSAQTMRDDVQFLVSDNASTDATPAILEKWAARDKRFRLHRQDRNIGVYLNFEWLMNNAGTRWFSFAAHDDLWSPDFAAALHKAITERPGFVLAIPQVVTMFEDGREDTRRPIPEKMNTGSKIARIRHMLRESRGGWYAGLWDRQALIAAMEKAKNFPHVWGFDPVTILSSILAGAVTGSNDAIYYKRLTPSSEELYRPKTARDQYILYRDFLRESLRRLGEAPLSRPEKILLAPSVIRYARHGVKPKRIVKTALREALRSLRR